MHEAAKSLNNDEEKFHESKCNPLGPAGSVDLVVQGVTPAMPYRKADYFLFPAR